jgi:hypothetical protein
VIASFPLSACAAFSAPPLSPQAWHPEQRLFELSSCERMLVRSMRHWTARRRDWQLVRQEVWLLCGSVHMVAALDGLTGLLDTLARDGRRRLRMHPVSGRRVAADEWRLLELIAARQRRRDKVVEVHLTWLLPFSKHRAAREPLANLAEALLRGHSLLPDRLVPLRQSGVAWKPTPAAPRPRSGNTSSPGDGAREGPLLRA